MSSSKAQHHLPLPPFGVGPSSADLDMMSQIPARTSETNPHRSNPHFTDRQPRLRIRSTSPSSSKPFSGHHSYTCESSPGPSAPRDMAHLPIRDSTRDSISSGSGSTSRSSNSSTEGFMNHRSRRLSDSTNPTTAPSSPTLQTHHRTWRPTTNVPQHIARRHRAAVGGPSRNRWLSDDEGETVSKSSSGSGSLAEQGQGSMAIGRRRRGSGGAIGTSTSSAGLGINLPPSQPSSSKLPDRSPIFTPDLPIPKFSTRPHHTPRPELRGRRRSSPPKTKSTLSASHSTGEIVPSLAAEPPSIADLVPPPRDRTGARVLRTQMALIDPPGASHIMSEGKTERGDQDAMEGVEPENKEESRGESSKEEPAKGESKEEKADSDEGGSGSGSEDVKVVKEGGQDDPREGERQRVWRAGLLGQLKKLLTWYVSCSLLRNEANILVRFVHQVQINFSTTPSLSPAAIPYHLNISLFPPLHLSQPIMPLWHHTIKPP